MDIGSLYFRYSALVLDLYRGASGSIEYARDLTTEFFLTLLRRGIFEIPAQGVMARRWILDEARAFAATISVSTKRSLLLRRDAASSRVCRSNSLVSHPAWALEANHQEVDIPISSAVEEHSRPLFPNLCASRAVRHYRYREALRATRGRIPQ